MRRSVLCLLLLAAPLAAQQPAGTIGQYTPPRDWPLRKSAFDLLHQRIDVSFDMARRMVTGTVRTRVAVTAPTDTLRLDAGNLTIDGAADARGKTLRFTYDTSHVTVRLPRRARQGDTVEFALRYHTVPERGIYFVPRRHVIWSQGEATETRNWIPTYDAANDKTTWEFYVTADSGMKVLSNGRLVGVKAAPHGQQAVHGARHGLRGGHAQQRQRVARHLGDGVDPVQPGGGLAPVPGRPPVARPAGDGPAPTAPGRRLRCAPA